MRHSLRCSLTPWLLAAGLVMALAAPVAGQFRVRGGLDIAEFFGDDAGDTDTRQELSFGAAFTVLHFGPVSVSPEVYYRQKGARSVEEFNRQIIESGSAEIGLDYVEIPVLLRVNLPKLGNVAVPYLNGGPAFGWRFDCSIALEAETGMAEQRCEDLSGENLEETLRDYEVGAVFGGGFDIPILGIGAINLDARVTQGLSRLNDVNGDGSVDVKNRVFSLMLGYSFGLPGPFTAGGGPMIP